MEIGILDIPDGTSLDDVFVCLQSEERSAFGASRPSRRSKSEGPPAMNGLSASPQHHRRQATHTPPPQQHDAQHDDLIVIMVGNRSGDSGGTWQSHHCIYDFTCISFADFGRVLISNSYIHIIPIQTIF